MEQIKRALGNRPLMPDLPGIARFINEELKPLVADLRSRLNGIIGAVPLPSYAQGSEPLVTGPSLVWNTTTNKVRYFNGAAWVDLP